LEVTPANVNLATEKAQINLRATISTNAGKILADAVSFALTLPVALDVFVTAAIN